MAICDEYVSRYSVCKNCNNEAVDCGREKCPVYKAPAADVVPKSEVARVISDFAKMAKEKIDQKDGHIEEHYGKYSYWEYKYFYDTEIEDIIDEIEAELKKKYTEEKE